MRKIAATLFSVSIMPLLFACSTSTTGSNAAVNVTHPAAPVTIPARISYLPDIRYQYVYTEESGTITETYTKAMPDLTQLPDDVKWIRQLKGVWLRDTDTDDSGATPPSTGWFFENDKYQILCDGGFRTATILLEYPIVQNASWEQSKLMGKEKGTHTVVAIGLNITTPAGRFRNVVEVKRVYSSGYTVFDYLAPHVGSIKFIGLWSNGAHNDMVLTDTKRIG